MPVFRSRSQFRGSGHKETSTNSNSNSTKEKEMADFRKWFMVIAVVLLAAATANAQPSYTMPCSMVANTELLRVGGLTEPVGELDLNCDSTKLSPLGSFVTAQFTMQFNAVVTNSIITGNKTMAGALVQYALAPYSIQS